MIVWQLHRDDVDLDHNTVRGVLNGRGAPGQAVTTFQTVENFARRIPMGTYVCKADLWLRGDLEDVPTFEIQWPWDEDGDGLPDRDRLLFHPANAVRNRTGKLSLLGCVAPGLSRVDDVWETFYPNQPLPPLAQHLPGVADSQKAFDQFMVHNAGVREFTLKVTEAL